MRLLVIVVLLLSIAAFGFAQSSRRQSTIRRIPRVSRASHVGYYSSGVCRDEVYVECRREGLFVRLVLSKRC